MIHSLFLTEICAVSKVSKKDIGRVFKLILKTLETSVELITTGDFMVNYIVIILYVKFTTKFTCIFHEFLS